MSKNIATFSEYIGCIVESKGKREAIGHISLTANGKLSYIGVYEKFSDSFQIEFEIGWLKEPFLTGPLFGNRLFVGIHSANDSVGFLMSRDTLGWDDAATEHLGGCNVLILDKIPYGFLGKDVSTNGEEVEFYGNKYIVSCLCGKYTNFAVGVIKSHTPKP